MDKVGLLFLVHPEAAPFWVAAGAARGKEAARRKFIECARLADDIKFTATDEPNWHTARWPIVAQDAPPEAVAAAEARQGKPAGQAIDALTLNYAMVANPETSPRDRAPGPPRARGENREQERRDRPHQPLPRLPPPDHRGRRPRLGPRFLNPPQRRGQVLGRLPALVGVLDQGGLDHMIEAGGETGWSDETGGGARSRMAAMRLARLPPSKARRPVTISCSSAPKAKRSARASTSFPSSCSGAM